MFTIKAIYSPDIYYCNAEMLEKGLDIDVQEVVESPEMYILGQAADSLAEKLSYTSARLEDINNLEEMKCNNKTVNDELRFFIGKHISFLIIVYSTVDLQKVSYNNTQFCFKFS